MCRRCQTIFTPESNVELELAEEEEEEEEGDEEESQGRVIQLVSCGRYEEAVLLAYGLWEKRKEDEKPEERENDVRESAMQLVERMSKGGTAVALQILEAVLDVWGNLYLQDTEQSHLS